MRNTTLTTLRTRLKASLLTLLLLALPLGANAAGLGKLTVLSALGQPLRAEVDISASREELASLAARIAPQAAFQSAGIEFSPALTAIRFSIAQRPDGQPFLSMVSERAFNEPFLDLLVELNWSSGRLVREYTFLLDPPESLHKPQGAAAAALSLPEVRREAPQAAQPPAVVPPAAVVAPPAAVQTPAPSVAPAPPVVAPQPESRPAPAIEEKAQAKPRSDMQVVRGTDGVQRIVKAEPTAAEKSAKEAATRQVKQGDTLGKIAAESKPEGVNLDQMLVALFRSNEDAFIGNVNRLKAGKILTIPDRETVAGIDADDARKTIQAHSADFNAYSKKLAATVVSAPAPKAEEAKRAASGKIAPKVEEKAPVSAGKDKLEVSKSELARDAAGKAGAGRLAAIEETLVSREKALKDANSRIADLEKNLKDLQKLVELKNQSMADLQKQAQAAKPPVPPSAKELAVAPPKPVAKAADKAPENAPAATPPKAAEPAPVTPAAKPEAPPQPPAAAKPAPAEIKPIAPPPPVAPAELSFVDESPEIVYGGAGVLALLLAYLGYSRRRKQQQAAASSGDETEPSDGLLATAVTPAEPTEDLLSPTDFSSEPAGVEPNASVDPVAEAEVYLAYGRDTQAEEILVDALKADPTRLAIHLKLLEIYAARTSVKQFEAIARDVHGLTGGTGDDWEKVRQLALPVDPANPLYGFEQAAPPAEFDPDATMLIEPGAAADEMPALEPSFDSVEPAPEDLIQASLDELAEPAEPVVEEPAPEEVPASLDFDFDVPLAAQVSAPTESESLELAAAPEGLSGALDMDLELGAPATIEPPAASKMSTVVDMDFDLELGTPTPAADVAAAPAAAPADAAGGLDFDFDLDNAKAGAVTEATGRADIPPESAEDSVIDFDLELPAPAAEKPAAPVFDMASINLDLDAPPEAASEPRAEAPAAPPAAAAPAAEIDDSALQDVATKLELAQAYEEMGDKEGARELLQEVLSEGNAAQQEAARNKLAQLG